MKKIKITTPENIEVEYTLADVGSRTAAGVIDILIQTIIILILFGIIMVLRYTMPIIWEKYYGWIVGIGIIIGAIINYAYFIFMEIKMNGQTIGKKVLKLRAIRNNGQPLSLKHSAIRNLFKMFIDILGIGVVFIFFSKEHKRIGDYAASTIVIIEISRSTPISLENLNIISENLQHYLSKDEYEVLTDYIERKNIMKNSSAVKEEIVSCFSRKFDNLGILDLWKDFEEKAIC